ncbi:MAG: tRNA epoxyqueuosine(34) reductase QueG [Deltaproteobacteria bacterium]|nr:tRNA epoxyqueuosine(34) reductase QueG [Deltaproteobacteria bacterium]
MARAEAAAIRALAADLGIDRVGFASAAPLVRAARRIQQAGRDPDEPETTCDPGEVLPGARSVIVAAQGYLTDEPADGSRPGDPHGLVARYNWRDHYGDLRKRLKALASGLSRLVGEPVRTRVGVNGRLAEKPLAVRAGVGGWGRHGIVVAGPLGSWVVLGEVVTDLEIQPDPPGRSPCGTCRACMSACPTGAIVAPRILDRSRCIQHLSGRAGPLPVDLYEAWGPRLYGCTVCQDVCPLNERAPFTDRRPARGAVGASLPLLPVLTWSEETFRARVAGNQMAASWVAWAAIRRNACLALGHRGDRVAVPALETALARDPDAGVRDAAAWALERLRC